MSGGLWVDQDVISDERMNRKTNYISGSAPSTMQDGQIWVDNVNNVVNFRNGANNGWLTLLNASGSISVANITSSGSISVTGTVDGVDISSLLIKTTKISDLATIWTKATKITVGDTTGSFPPSAHTHEMSDITGLSLDWSAIDNKPTTFDPSPHTHSSSQISDWSTYINQALLTSSSPTFAGETINGNISVTGTVDGVDISELLLKTSKVADLATIWDKTTKIAFGDTSITKSDLSLGNVENTALSTWVGTSNITTLGTITMGVWSGSVIDSTKLDLADVVPKTTTVNSHPLTGSVTVTKSDVGLSSVENTALSTWKGTVNVNTVGTIYTGSWSGSTINASKLDLSGVVPTSRTVAGHALSANVTLNKTDVGLNNVENTALSTWKGTTNVNTLGTITTGSWSGSQITASKLDLSGVVPTSRTVNGKALSSNITLTATDVGLGPSNSPTFTTVTATTGIVTDTVAFRSSAVQYSGTNQLITGNLYLENALGFKVPYKVERWDTGSASWVDITSSATWGLITDNKPATSVNLGPFCNGDHTGKIRFYYDAGGQWKTPADTLVINRQHFSYIDAVIVEQADDTAITTNVNVLKNHTTSLSGGDAIAVLPTANWWRRYLRIELDVRETNASYYNELILHELMFMSPGYYASSRMFDSLIPIDWNYNREVYFYNLIRPTVDNSYNIGTSGYRWHDAYIGGDIYINGSVDGVDVSALLLKTTKVTDLATIWDKTTKIAQADTTITTSTLGIGNVENTALSTWKGTVNVNTLGTVKTGSWQATVIDSAYLDLADVVPKTTTVNGHALSGNVTVTKSDVGLGSVENTALSTWAGTANITTVGNITSGTWSGSTIVASKLDLTGVVPTSRTVNSKALSSNITITASDVGLGSVENTALSTWKGTTNVNTLGTIYTGSWSGSQIVASKLDLSGVVPTSRTVNGHALSSNVTVTKSDVSLGNVENTALSTWKGTANVNTLGTVKTGSWQASAITCGYLNLNSAAGTKTADLANIWSKSTKIAFADTTITKSDLGLGSVENTALSTWKGTTNINTLGTVTTGSWSASVIAAAKLDLSGVVPTSRTVNGHALSANVTVTKGDVGLGSVENTALSTWSAGRTVNGHALNANVTVTKGDVGLGNVENTALSTWSGSSNITTVGTLASLTVSTKLVIPVLASDPASPVTGQMWIVTS